MACLGICGEAFPVSAFPTARRRLVNMPSFPGGGTYHGHAGVSQYPTLSRAGWAEYESRGVATGFVECSEGPTNYCTLFRSRGETLLTGRLEQLRCKVFQVAAPSLPLVRRTRGFINTCFIFASSSEACSCSMPR